MTRTYRVQSVEPRTRLSHHDFLWPRNEVTLHRIEDGEVLRVLLPIRTNCRPGEEIRLEDPELHAAMLRT